MTMVLKQNLDDLSSHKKKMHWQQPQKAVLLPTCEKETSSEYKVAAQPITTLQNKHSY